ncbi:MAG: hypothetical protein RJB38_2450 [Pseudomonadota bacterium]|jgi:hypothetical protein
MKSALRLGFFGTLAMGLGFQDSAQAQGAGPAPVAPAGTYERYDNQARPTGASDDDCEYSTTVDGKWSCSGTKTMITGAQVANQVSQIGGAAAVQVMGQQQTAQASQSGRQSDAYSAGAKMASQTATIEMATGAANLALGIYNFTKGMAHNKNAKEAKKIGSAKVTVGLDGTATASTEQAQQAMTNFQLSEDAQYGKLNLTGDQAKDQAALRSKERHMQMLLSDVARRSGGEQSKIASEAKAQGMMSAVTGAGQLMNGYAHKKMAEAMRNSADQLKDFEAQNPIMPRPILGPGNGTMNPYNGGMAPPVIVSKEPNPEGTPTSSPVEVGKSEDREDPLPVGLKDQNFAGLPTPGPQAMNSAGGSGGGAGPVSGAGISGGGGGGPQGEGAAPAMPNERDPRYNSGEGGAGYSAAAGAAGGESGGPDLSGLLEKMTEGQKQEFAGQAGIEEFGRNPAGEPYSFLDKSVNIFQRVHQAYQSKAKAGRVALF